MAGGKVASRSIVAETYRPEAYSEKRALVRDGFKYIHSWTDDREWEELYDLAADPGELHDLSAIEVERLAAMRTALQDPVARRRWPKRSWRPSSAAMTSNDCVRSAISADWQADVTVRRIQPISWSGGTA